MIIELISPKKALNKAYLKEKVSRIEIQNFKHNLKVLIGKINEKESEEHLKNLVSDFLKNTWYRDTNEINTKGRNDLVIHTGKSTTDPVGVLLEVKHPTNKAEMVSTDRINVKAFHELILYYLRERFENNNIHLRHLIFTNIYEWYIVDENWFERNIYRNTKLKKDFESWKVSGKDTRAFYDDIAKAHLNEISEHFQCAYFDIRDFKNIVDANDEQEDIKLIALYKLLSPVNLLKLPFANDSNSLDKSFYSELLHIIGLEEKKVRGRRLIQRKDKPSHASILENCIIQLEDRECINNIESLYEYGNKKADQVYAVALELTITWINRILFLKLLEAQLYQYHDNDRSYRFLNIASVRDYSELNTLFFQVLAQTPKKRHDHLKERYRKVPYLNSSLFERTELERKTIDIGSLLNDTYLDLATSTVLKDERGFRKNGSVLTLQYLFDFLDAYDFSSEGPEDIQEENKSLINASVLGLIFEKINGYKDGSFFTPGSITMFICRETIRKAVLRKFNEVYNLDCREFGDLKNYIASKYHAQNILEFNRTLNELKICDPAVGSGHFLVSALNEIITIKAELGILADTNGHRLGGYEIRAENDELIITYNDNTEIFQYKIRNHSINSEVQRVQKTIFHEKEAIIEQCLFGVDLNPNSVKICRLRLWIELLKNTYYTEDSGFSELETLPNIDINIKSGNSLISRFPINNKAINSFDSKYSIEEYKQAFHDYHRAESKTKRAEIEDLLRKIKSDYTSVINSRDPLIIRLSNLRGRHANLYNKVKIGDLFSKTKKSEVQPDLDKLELNIKKLETTIENIRKNQVFDRAFEWRLEFPDSMNHDGSFQGFDVIIGNPPYVFGGNEGITTIDKEYFKDHYITGKGKVNLFTLFIERSFELLVDGGQFAFVIPNTFLRVTSYHDARRHLIENYTVDTIVDLGDSVFEDAITTAIIIVANKATPNDDHKINISTQDNENSIGQRQLKNANYVIATNINDQKRITLDKIESNSIALGEICKELIFGIVITKNKDEVVSNQSLPGWKPFLEGRDIGPFFIKPVHNFINYKPELLHRPRTKEIFEVPEKILLQRITGGSRPLKAAYDKNQYYNKESINNLILHEYSGFDYKYILGLLNSKLINWYYSNQFTNESKLTVNLSKEYLSQIPIYPASFTEQKPFVKIVDYLLFLSQPNLKQVDEYVPNTYLINLFSEILDAMVFEIYFKYDFDNASLNFIGFVEHDFFDLSITDEKENIQKIQIVYQFLRNQANKIRNNLKLMDIRVPELVMPIKTIR
ncbi:MAG: N-6 DNA methylase [Bacteroidetes bacterium]|nr:N-6 DNA methylase [Bacteroidota bacterium]